MFLSRFFPYYAVADLRGKAKVEFVLSASKSTKKPFVAVWGKFYEPHDITYIIGLRRYITIPVAIARRIHLFPFRTQKLSSVTPDVVGYNAPQDKVAAGFHLKPARFHIENGRVILFIMSFVRRTAAIAWIANRL